ncbi:MAG: glutaredoxin 3 [Alphaproteobacteria bacterium]
MPKIEVYSSPLCPFCTHAKRFLKGKGAEFDEYNVFMKPALKKEMVERAGGRTSVPQIFIDDRHIGGCDDLLALDEQGGLDPLLAG